MTDNRNTCADPYMKSFAQSFAEANYKPATIKAYRQLVHRLGRLMEDAGILMRGPNPWPFGDYEVGYCRPPREHQFKKGEASRNSKGRPRGANRPALDLVSVLMQPVTIRIKGKERKVPYPEALI